MSNEDTATHGLIDRVNRKIISHPEIFPNPSTLSDFADMPSWSTLDSKIPQEIWDILQINWIHATSRQSFVSALANRELAHASQNVKKEVDKRVMLIVEDEISAHPDLFPSPESVADLKPMPTRSALASRIPESKWQEWQLKWAKLSSNDGFISGLHHLVRASQAVDEAVNIRLTGIVGKAVHAHPESFPNVAAISCLDGMPSRMTLSERVPDAKLVVWQKHWIKTAPRNRFIDILSDGCMREVSETVAAAITARRIAIVKEGMDSHPETFPSASSFGNLAGMPHRASLSKIPQNKWDGWQIHWIQTSSEEHFISAFHSSKLAALPEVVYKEASIRIRRIVIDKLSAGVPSTKIMKNFFNWRSLNERIPDLGEVLGTASALFKRTSDQIIISRIGLDASKRKGWVNDLIAKRLEQLWFFRELLALGATGNADGASVVSFSHSELPARLKAVLPEVETTHIFLEEMEARVQQLRQRTILLSVLQWLSPERAANLMRNVALSTQNGNEVVFTFPQNHILHPEAFETLGHLGFELRKVGQLSLCPPKDMESAIAEKLTQVSNIAILRRLGVVGDGISAVDLFLKTENPEGYAATTEPHDISYTREQMESATPSLVLYALTAGITEQSIPRIVDIDSRTDGTGFITFANGCVAGFNMDPKRPNTPEVDGRNIDQATVDVVGMLIRGRSDGFRISDDLREKHSEFLRMIANNSIRDLKVRKVAGNRLVAKQMAAL